MRRSLVPQPFLFPSPPARWRSGSLVARLMSKIQIDVTTGCWIWTGGTSRGYGVVWAGGRLKKAHLAMYELWVGLVAAGKELDHFRCDNPPCCNPLHVRPATHRENMLRGNTLMAANLAKTHCPRGHPYEGANLIIKPRGRECRSCDRARKRRLRLIRRIA
jgi:hypothetical protein